MNSIPSLARELYEALEEEHNGSCVDETGFPCMVPSCSTCALLRRASLELAPPVCDPRAIEGCEPIGDGARGFAVNL